MSRVFKIPVSSVYPHHVAKVEKSGRTTAESDQVICWLTGYDESKGQPMDMVNAPGKALPA